MRKTMVGLALLVGMCAPAALAWNELVATVKVDGKANCLQADYRKVAQPIRLEPGQWVLYVEKGRGIIYGDRPIYRKRRPVNVIVRCDPRHVSVQNWPMAVRVLFQPDGHMTNSALEILVKQPTTLYAFLVDKRAEDNAGGVVLVVHKGEMAEIPPSEGKAFARVWVDGRKNCLSCDIAAIARKVTLSPGDYQVYYKDGAIAYSAGPEEIERATSEALLDVDPACMDWEDVGCGEPVAFGAPVGALEARSGRLTVLRRTNVYFYTLDLSTGDNSGAVTLEVRKGHSGI